jgi:hypothetical protein
MEGNLLFNRADGYNPVSSTALKQTNNLHWQIQHLGKVFKNDR